MCVAQLQVKNYMLSDHHLAGLSCAVMHEQFVFFLGRVVYIGVQKNLVIRPQRCCAAILAALRFIDNGP